MAGELDGKVAGEPIGALDNDRPDAVACNAVQKGREARPCGYGMLAIADCKNVVLPPSLSRSAGHARLAQHGDLDRKEYDRLSNI
jgi:hypothetical protein